ncbi:MAG: NAD(+) diphosphatase [Stellaceae bacterium]
MRQANFYTGGLDRATHRRKDQEWLAERLAHAASRFVPVWRGQSLVVGAQGGEPRAVCPPRAEISAPGIDESETVLLGLSGAQAYFAIDLSALEHPLQDIRADDRAEFVDLRRVGPLLPREEGALLAYARGILYWHAHHRFCAVCGHPSRPEEAGHLRRCSNAACGATHFPRTDPAVIMLVHDGDHCLLGRQRVWLPGMHSTLAGFVEPGESLEEAVAREVREETGIAVEDVAYHSSQPWPFPSSLMLGFYARARTRDIRLDGHELEAAHWFARDFILNHPDDDQFRLPRKDSIARRLIEEWLKSP